MFVKIRMLFRKDFICAEPVIAQEPVSLVQTMLTIQWRLGKDRQTVVAVNRNIGRVIHPFQVHFLIQPLRKQQNPVVRLRACADNHLRTLSCWRKARNFAAFLSLKPVRTDRFAEKSHRLENRLFLFLRSQPVQRVPGRQLDIDAESISIETGLPDQFPATPRNHLHMNVAEKFLFLTEPPYHRNHPLHRAVGALHNRRTEKKSFNVVPAIKPDGKVHKLLNSKGCSLHRIRRTVHAVCTIVAAVVGQQHFQKRNTTTVIRPGMTDPPR